MKIAVVDDEATFLDAFDRVLARCFPSRACYALSPFTDARDFLDTCAAAHCVPFDLVFLDILLPEKSGLELARELFKRDRACCIAYVTASPDYAVQGYGANAVGYLVKPVDEGRLRAVLDACEARRQEAAAARVIWLKERGGVRRLAADAILYLESEDKRVHIHCDDETIVWYGKLGELTERFSGRFLRVHQSYAVNLDRVVRLTGERIFLESGASVPVSYRYRKEVAARFFRAVAEEV